MRRRGWRIVRRRARDRSGPAARREAHRRARRHAGPAAPARACAGRRRMDPRWLYPTRSAARQLRRPPQPALPHRCRDRTAAACNKVPSRHRAIARAPAIGAARARPAPSRA